MFPHATSKSPRSSDLRKVQIIWGTCGGLVTLLLLVAQAFKFHTDNLWVASALSMPLVPGILILRVLKMTFNSAFLLAIFFVLLNTAIGVLLGTIDACVTRLIKKHNS